MEEVKAWIVERHPDLYRELDDFNGVFAVLPMRDCWCIRCRRTLRVCAHCFITEIRAWMDEQHPELSEEFVERFNYEIETPFNDCNC